MRIQRWVILLLLVVFIGAFLIACSANTPIATQTAIPTIIETPVPTLPPPDEKTTQVPDPEQAVQAYLDAWKVDDYASMYAMLTPISQDAITEEDYITFYTSVANEIALSDVQYDILGSFVQSTRSAQASYRVTLQSVLVGDISRDTIMNLSLEDGEWRVQWAEDLILPELAGGNYLWLERNTPSRANIYDRNEDVLVAFADAVSVGLVPAEIPPDDEGKILSEAQWLTGIKAEAIRYMYADWPIGVNWPLPLKAVLREKVDERYDVSNGYDDRGLVMWPYSARFYFDGAASQTIGYVSYIQENEVEKFKRKGYQQSEKVGRQGIEAWGEPYLLGTRGGTLYVLSPNGEIITLLADVPAQPSQAIYTTIDKDMQLAAENMLLKYRGAVVVMELDTGRVLAMASSPNFDPNAFEPQNANSYAQLTDYYDPYSGQPFLNRATQGQYPLGSVFKIITMAAGLESGVFTPESTYNCQYAFDEVQGLPPRYDWTWEHYQEDGETLPSGMLTLPEGLMRSCNPYFWHIGLELFRQGYPEAVAEMANGFGLGALTGIEGVEEEPGNIPIPETEVDALNNAIGQGDTLVTPLQVAQFIAAIGNGGTIYQPQVIERIAPPDGEATYEFEPIVKGELPVSPENLEVIQDAMISVVENRRGTAQFILGAYSRNSYSMAGKTGTAESGSGEPHAWFAGYTRENRENQPDIAIVVIAENAGEGSEVAAPIFRGVVQQYFEGQRYYRLPWEAEVGVLAYPEEEEVEE
jgi:penicillin-binding protein 2